MNPFKTLGLENNASIEKTKKRFRKLSMKMHPDKGGDEFITLEEGMCGCERNITLRSGTVKVEIPKGMLPMQSVNYERMGEKNQDGVRGTLCVTVKFIMPEGFTFERYLTETVLVYSVKLKTIPKTISITLCGKTKKIKMPSKLYDGMFLKVKDFGYCNGGVRHPLYVRICL